MRIVALSGAVSDGLADRRLLAHPFYRRWELGEVSMAELASYASQYRHFEGYLPGFLARLLGNLPDGPARRLIGANLADEQGDPVAHVELFEQFALAVGAGQTDPSPATVNLLATYDDLLETGPVDALAGFLAYEIQASDVAARKAEGLQRHYGLDASAVSFWAHHAAVDGKHAEWALQALDDLHGADNGPLAAVRRGAEAWWQFLEEREALRPGRRALAG
jgi:pyrroloquinoline-quinone synthase